MSDTDAKKDEAEPEYSDDGEYSDAEEPADVTQYQRQRQRRRRCRHDAPTLRANVMERLHDARHGQNYDPKHPPRQGGNSHSLSLSPIL